LLRVVQKEDVPSVPDPVSSESSVVVPETMFSSEKSVIDSWEKAMGQLSLCADFLTRDYSAHPTTYLLTLALQYGQDSFRQAAPSSETRLTLKRANEGGEWNGLLQYSLAALREGYSRPWLDLNRYVWQASEATGSPVLRNLVLTQTRVLLENDISVAETLFDDDTPVANAETRQWLTSTILPATPQVEHRELPSLAPEPALVTPQQDDPEMDSYSAAHALALRGELTAAIELLFANRTVRPGSRADFMTRLQLCHLCLESGRGEIVLPIMRQMLAAIDERKLDGWEEPEVLTELYSLHLKALSTTDNASEREELYARLCEINPAAAIAFEMAR
jgi:hypothetical protein